MNIELSKGELAHRILELLDEHKECIKVEKNPSLFHSEFDRYEIAFKVNGLTVEVMLVSKARGTSSRATVTLPDSRSTTLAVTSLESELMIKKLIKWYKDKMEFSKNQEEKAILMEAIHILENYKPE